MTMVTTISLAEFIGGLKPSGDVEDDRYYAEAYTRLAVRAFERGDKVLVYENQDLGHRDLGCLKVTTYGSAASMIEASQFPEPPTTLPDIGGDINWRYQLRHIIERRW